MIESPRVVIDELQADRRKMKSQISVMGNELQQAKLTLELVRDVLKNAKADQTIDSLIGDVVVRIDRILNPEKFKNALTHKTQVAVRYLRLAKKFGGFGHYLVPKHFGQILGP